jgi:hypothetical protein
LGLCPIRRLVVGINPTTITGRAETDIEDPAAPHGGVYISFTAKVVALPSFSPVFPNFAYFSEKKHV